MTPGWVGQPVLAGHNWATAPGKTRPGCPHLQLVCTCSCPLPPPAHTIHTLTHSPTGTDLPWKLPVIAGQSDLRELRHNHLVIQFRKQGNHVTSDSIISSSFWPLLVRKFAEISDLRKDFVCRVCEPFSQQQASQSRIIAKLELGRSWFYD